MLAIASGRDAASLPRAGRTLDVEACMKPSRLRDAIRALLVDDAAACIAAAARVRDELSRDASGAGPGASR